MTTQADFFNPITTASYTLCVYSGAGETLSVEAVVPPGTNWTPLGTKGYKYKDASGTNDGIQKIILKGGAQNKAKCLAKGKGANLPFESFPVPSNPALLMDPPVKVQLVNEQNGICFEGLYNTGDIKKNEPGKFKGKAQ
jgi:hypothetical protein